MTGAGCGVIRLSPSGLEGQRMAEHLRMTSYYSLKRRLSEGTGRFNSHGEGSVHNSVTFSMLLLKSSKNVVILNEISSK